ncbi:MAG TPA: hypothetical protein VM243_18425 [Phycisphaerae bacterium]|nr:hypothetical protein [Phycisphaerae bacterium]
MKSMATSARISTSALLLLATGLMYGCATGGGGGGGGPSGAVEFPVETGTAGNVELTETGPGQSAGQGIDQADLGGQAPPNTISGTASVTAENDNVTFTGDGMGTGRQAEITIHVAPAGAEDPCANEFAVLDFTATEGADGVIALAGTTEAGLTGDILQAVADNDFVFCIQVAANFPGSVNINTVDITLLGGAPPTDGDTGGFFTCSSPGGQDTGVEFAEPGTTQVIASTIGEGRHMVLADGWDLIYEFDQPVRFCAVVAERFTLTDLTTGTELDLPEANLAHQHIVENGVVDRSRVFITLPSGLTPGNDYELVISAKGLSLDGEFQKNAGTANAKNGTLPSGNETPGGDFVQLFRAVGYDTFLTGTPSAGGMVLDGDDRLYIVGGDGLYGPFDAPGEVTEGQRLGDNLPALASRTVAFNADGNLIVKDATSEGKLFEVNPDTGLGQEVARLPINSVPRDLVAAPDGYASVERAGAAPGDLIWADDSGLSVPDFAAGTGKKGAINLVDRSAGDITSAYVSLWVPPARTGKPREIYGAFRPEDSRGFEIHRILPNGVVDTSVLENPAFLPSIDGTAATQLQDIQGREEFMFLGRIDLNLRSTKQIIPAEFVDGSWVTSAVIYNKTEDRMQMLLPLPLDTFAFVFEPFSQVEITSDLDTTYISLPSLQEVQRFTGLANGAAAAGDPPCDSDFDEGIDFGAEGTGKVFRSSLGNGRHLLEGSPAVLMFDIDLPVRFCSVTPDNVTLAEMETGTAIPLDDHDIRRVHLYDAAGLIAGSRILVNLPDDLTAGTYYELTLSGDGLNIDGEFQQDNGTNRRNGTLPSGDGTPGGDFVQIFQLIEGSNYLTETFGATGIALDANDTMYIANGADVFGPFEGPGAVTAGDMFSDVNDLSGGGRPIVVDDDGNVVVAELRDGRIGIIDPATQINDNSYRGPGESFETDIVVLPEGFDDDLGRFGGGDLLVVNFGRGFIPDFVNGGIKTGANLFTDPEQLADYVNLYVPPADVFGTMVLGVYSGLSDGVAVREITPQGDQIDQFDTLTGATALAGMSLSIYQGDVEYLLLGNFDSTTSPLLTGQIRVQEAGLELMVYDPARSMLQVIGVFSAAEGTDMTFTQNLNQAFFSLPAARKVVQLEGLAAE